MFATHGDGVIHLAAEQIALLDGRVMASFVSRTLEKGARLRQCLKYDPEDQCALKAPGWLTGVLCLPC
jgi:hypothetical protein